MATPPRGNPPPTPIRVLLRQTLAQLFASLQKGVRSLGTPKGLLAIVPIIVSVVAYVKASYVTTNLFVLFIEPITMQVTLTDGMKGPATVNDFEMFLISEGREAVYTTGINLNIAVYNEKGTFDERFQYLIPKNPTTTSVIPPYLLSAKPLSKDYAYSLHSGFIVSANTVLPMSAHLHFDQDKREDDRISAAVGGTKMEDDQRANELLLNEKSYNPPIAFCISGTAFTSGGVRQRFLWHTDSKDGDIGANYQDQKAEAIPTQPGGKPVPAEDTKRLVIVGPHFDRPITLYTARKFTFF
jgi:hypothetical protein